MIVKDERPLAPPEYEEAFLKHFQAGLSVEEYAAREGHNFAMFPHYKYRYREPGLTEWVGKLGEFFFQDNLQAALREVRERYLTRQERERAEEFERDPF